MSLRGTRRVVGRGPRDQAGCESGVPRGMPTGRRPGGVGETPLATGGSQSGQGCKPAGSGKPKVLRAEPRPATRGLWKRGAAEDKEAVMGTLLTKAENPTTPPPRLHTAALSQEDPPVFPLQPPPSSKGSAKTGGCTSRGANK